MIEPAQTRLKAQDPARRTPFERQRSGSSLISSSQQTSSKVEPKAPKSADGRQCHNVAPDPPCGACDGSIRCCKPCDLSVVTRGSAHGGYKPIEVGSPKPAAWGALAPRARRGADASRSYDRSLIVWEPSLPTNASLPGQRNPELECEGLQITSGHNLRSIRGRASSNPANAVERAKLVAAHGCRSGCLLLPSWNRCKRTAREVNRRAGISTRSDQVPAPIRGGGADVCAGIPSTREEALACKVCRCTRQSTFRS